MTKDATDMPYSEPEENMVKDGQGNSVSKPTPKREFFMIVKNHGIPVGGASSIEEARIRLANFLSRIGGGKEVDKDKYLAEQAGEIYEIVPVVEK
jgi:hypothetical protein